MTIKVDFEHSITRNEYYTQQEADTSADQNPEVPESVPAGQRKTASDTSFMEYGNCNGLPPSVMCAETGSEVEVAKEICRLCVVRVECLEYALANREQAGVWGGTSIRERRKILKNRRTRNTNE